MNIQLLHDANKEIAKLKAKLVSQQLAHDDEITNIETVNDSISRLTDDKVKSLKDTNDQQQAMLNFQSAQYNDMHDRGIKRENEVINLKRKIAELEYKSEIDQVQLVKQNDGWPYCGLSLK